MALNPPRRPRGAAVGAEALYVRIAPEAMATLTDAATRCGVSKADFVEALALHLRESIDERGVPGLRVMPFACILATIFCGSGFSARRLRSETDEP